MQIPDIQAKMQLPDIQAKTQQFLSNIGAAASPTFQQARGQAQQLVSNMFGAMPGSVQRTASQAGGIIPGAMQALNLPGAQTVRQFQQSRGAIGNIPSLTASRALGYGTMAAAGLGAVGAGAVLGAQLSRNKKERLAGQNLGAQLGVNVPPAY